VKLYSEQRFGLVRACVAREGQPLLYAEGPALDTSLTLWGTRSVARLTAKSGRIGFLRLADGQDAMADLSEPDALNEGTAVEVEIAAEARADKLPRARLLGVSEGPPRRLSDPLTLIERLKQQARRLIDPQVRLEPAEDPDALDIAEAQATQPSFDLPGGGYLSIEPTRALIACDIDMGRAGEGMIHTPRQAAKRLNEVAVEEVVRRLRLSNLAGLVVVDLIGNKHNGEKLTGLVQAAFGAEGRAIACGPITRFGTLEFSRPWGARPHTEDTPLRAARRLLWRAVAEARSDAGGRLRMRAPGPVADQVRLCLKDSLDPLAPRLSVETAAMTEVVPLR
jgi:hypothetical protein